MSSPSGIDGLGASGRILLSSTSVFGEVLLPSAGVDPGVPVEGLLPGFSDGEDLFEDMAGYVYRSTGEDCACSGRWLMPRSVLGDCCFGNLSRLSKGT